MNVFRLFGKLGLDSKDYKKGLDTAEKNTKSFSQRLGSAIKTAGAAATAAIGAISAAAMGLGGKLISEVNKISQYGDTVDKMSQKIGLSAEAYQKWDYVLKISGSEMSNMTIGLKTLTNQIDEAKNGSDDAQKKFAALGITMEQLQRMSREEVFEAAISGFQRMADSTERAALANDLFGRSGQDLAPLFNTTIEETQALIKEVEESGSIMSDEAVKSAAKYHDSLTYLKQVLTGVKMSIFNDFLPAFSSVSNGLAKIFSGDSGGIKQISEGLSNIVDNVIKAGKNIIEKGGEIIKSLGDVIIQNAPTIFSAVVSLLENVITYTTSKLPELIHVFMGVISQVVTVLLSNLPEIFRTASQIIVELANGIGAALPELIPAIVDVILTIVKQLTSPESLGNVIDAALTIIMGLVDGIIAALPVLLDALPVIVDNIITVIGENIPKIINAVVKIILKIVEYLIQPDTIGQLISAVFSIIASLIRGIIESIPQFIQAVIEIIAAILSTIGDWLGSLSEKGGEMINALWEGLKSGIAKAFEWGKDLIHNFIEGIKSGWNKLKEGIVNIGQGIKDFLGFSEPEKGPLSDFHTYAPDMMKLFADGIKDNEHLITDQLNKSFDFEVNGPTAKTAAYGTQLTGKSLTLILEVDKQKFARTVVDLARLEEQRQGRILFSV